MTNTQDRIGTSHDEAQLRYLRAAEYAQQKKYGEAEAEFVAALAMNPTMYTARFQLGLLQLTNGNVAAARTTWAELLDPNAPINLQHFVRGLDALIHDDFPTAIAHLQTGISLNTSNAPLNKDMAMVIAKIQDATANGQPAVTNEPIKAAPAAETEPAPARTDFSLYEKKF